jgi:hypothetical protein
MATGLITTGECVLKISNIETPTLPAHWDDYSNELVELAFTKSRTAQETRGASGYKWVAVGTLSDGIDRMVMVQNDTLIAALVTASEANETRSVEVYSPDETAGSTKWAFDIVPTRMPQFDFQSERSTVPTFDLGAYIVGTVEKTTVT